ncbi:MAG: S-methyl-5-thioribose-1-phosphate isomerase [Bacillota bacterium]
MKAKSIRFENGSLYLLDQRHLPLKCEEVKCDTYKEVEHAIRDMIVRGAPVIGVAGAYAVALAAQEFKNMPKEEFLAKMQEASRIIACARPTAVNLNWAVRKMEGLIKANQDLSTEDICQLLLAEADRIAREDREINYRMAKWGNEIIPPNATILTHCNTGALATVDYGTALGVIREAHNAGKKIRVYVDETRPRLQGARLTAWELVQEGIPSTLISDSVAATLLRDGKIDLVLVGADRIALNGDTANKIGTYMLSEIAKRFEIPFYVVAPISTIDIEIESGKEIVIEERDKKEVTHIGAERVAPLEIDVYNPAFDVTPHENITGIITEEGIVRAPYKENIIKLGHQ